MRMVTRLGMILFVIAAILGVGVLAVLWFAWEPLLPAASWLAGMAWFDVALLVVLGIVALGLLAMLITAIAAPKRASELSLKRKDGTVSVTEEAIRSTAERTLASHGNLVVKSLKVAIRGTHNPSIVIKADVEPGMHANLASLGESLQRDVSASVNTLTGYSVKAVDITFAGKTEAARIQRNAASTRKEASYVEYKRQGQSVLSA